MVTPKQPACLIRQSACGLQEDNPICPKCGLDVRVGYVSKEDGQFAANRAEAQFWKNEAREMLAEKERLEREAKATFEREALEKKKAEEAKQQVKVEKQMAPAPEVFQDHPMAPQMVELPRGGFLMGSADNEANARPNERPQHKVTIAYKLTMGRYPVTFDEWNACVLDGGTQYNPQDENWGRGKCPVINVSWEDTQAYIAWLNNKLGIQAKDPHRYRLPSEAEWEYACRSGSQGKWCFGDDEGQLQKYAWYDANSGGQTHTVGQKNANAFGLYDMHGNVWEWVQDSYGDDYEGAPSNASAWGGLITSFIGKVLGRKNDSGTRVLRGGSCGFNARYSRSANRNNYAPVYRYADIGFRLARTVP